MKPPGAATDAATVREFLITISAQAKAALARVETVGLLQISRLHPASESLVPSRYMLDDVERMIAAAVSDSAAGHNVYIEGRTVRADLRGNVRGALADTVAVFALVIDSDADKQMGWSPTVPVSMTVATSPGNFQFWFFLREAVNAEVAQKLGERIRAAINSDHDSGNPTQPYRVAGTINYPNAKKLERGRVAVPTQLLEFDVESLWTPEEIEQAFPLPERKTNGGTAAVDTADAAGIPADTMAAIRAGVEKGQQSDVFWNVVLVLKRSGWSIDAIIGLLQIYPDGIAKKYSGRLRHEVERAYGKIKIDGSAAQQQSAPAQPSPNAVELKDMTFKPIKYVVPGIIVEGLTLLAGKPKLGKSWLLLHAAIAVAHGGFTLGDIHCIEGDVLYCALEDNLRRLQSRMIKLMGATQSWPERLRFKCEMPRLSEGGLDVIKNWIASVAHPRLIIIDTLAMIRAPTKQKEQTQYDADYAAVLELRTLANEHGLAIVVVHHLRKMAADDPFDTISGTLGLSGAPDSTLVLKYDSSGSGTIVLHGRGRDLVEIEKAMTFNRDTCVWTISGELVDVRSSGARKAVLSAMQEIDAPASARDIAAYTRINTVNVRRMLQRMAKDGAVKRLQRGKYQLVAEMSGNVTGTGQPT